MGGNPSEGLPSYKVDDYYIKRKIVVLDLQGPMDLGGPKHLNEARNDGGTKGLENNYPIIFF
jgi:hypothetical protein